MGCCAPRCLNERVCHHRMGRCSSSRGPAASTSTADPVAINAYRIRYPVSQHHNTLIGTYFLSHEGGGANQSCLLPPRFEMDQQGIYTAQAIFRQPKLKKKRGELQRRRFRAPLLTVHNRDRGGGPGWVGLGCWAVRGITSHQNTGFSPQITRSTDGVALPFYLTRREACVSFLPFFFFFSLYPLFPPFFLGLTVLSLVPGAFFSSSVQSPRARAHTHKKPLCFRVSG
ncbi:hypothetical protein BJV74DRAFT_99425 [Russula compacta]|nr:hypothetical protein BJV74DRAFT_99425 [Russula compacta]